MPACNLLPSLRKFTARHIWTLTTEAHFTNNATLNYISGLKLVVTIISKFKFCISCIFHLYSCKKILAHSHLLAQGCIATVSIFCVFVYFCARLYLYCLNFLCICVFLRESDRDIKEADRTRRGGKKGAGHFY